MWSTLASMCKFVEFCHTINNWSAVARALFNGPKVLTRKCSHLLLETWLLKFKKCSTKSSCASMAQDHYANFEAMGLNPD
jgi:hypothetical protein